MFQRLFAVALTAFFVVFAAPAHAAPITTTTTLQGVVDTFVDVVPTCAGGGPLYTITTTSNLVEHETVFADGTMHATFTQTGTFSAVPLNDASLPTFTGRFAAWGGFNQSGQDVNGTSTFSVRGTGSDGSTFTNHGVDHFNQRPDGTVQAFFHCH